MLPSADAASQGPRSSHLEGSPACCAVQGPSNVALLPSQPDSLPTEASPLLAVGVPTPLPGSPPGSLTHQSHCQPLSPALPRPPESRGPTADSPGPADGLPHWPEVRGTLPGPFHLRGSLRLATQPPPRNCSHSILCAPHFPDLSDSGAGLRAGQVPRTGCGLCPAMTWSLVLKTLHWLLITLRKKSGLLHTASKPTSFLCSHLLPQSPSLTSLQPPRCFSNTSSKF